MELVVQLNNEDTEAFGNIESPGQGYFTNWSILVGALSEEAFDEGELSISKNRKRGQSTSPRSKQDLTFRLNDLQARFNRFFTKKKVYVNYKDRLIVSWSCDVSTDVNIVIQATFVPKPGSILRARRSFEYTTDTGVDKDKAWFAPCNGRLVGVEAKIVTVTADAAGGIHEISLFRGNERSDIDNTQTNDDGDTVSHDNEFDNQLKYGLQSIAKWQVASENNAPKAYSFSNKLQEPTAKLDYFYPVVYTRAGVNTNLTMDIEIIYYLQVTGDNERELIEEYLYADPDASFLDWSTLIADYGGGLL